MPAQQISNTFKVEIDGTPLPSGIDVVRIEVEDHLHLPDTFQITMQDTSRTAIERSKAKIGSKINISVLSDAMPGPQKLFIGEITAIDAELLAGVSYTMLRGYDESHRLFRGTVTASYQNMTASDVATKVARRCNLVGGTIDSTTPIHKHITQFNESNWTFLSRLARECGCEVFVSDKKLNFKKPKSAQSAPDARDLQVDEPLVLQAGSTLLYLRASVSASEQVKEVEVRCWDVEAKKAVVATAPVQTSSIINAIKPADLAETFPAEPLVSTSTPFATSNEVESVAKALAEHIASGFTQLDGMARGNPKLRSGAAVNVGLLGAPFDGKYVLTSTRHCYDHDEGYVTTFVVSGDSEQSLVQLASGGPSSEGGIGRIDGVVPAVVDDVNDPQQQCRVRLQFPWLAEKYVSDWARVVQAGAGKNRGFVVMPEVGDEVLVAFEQGEVRRPFVIGGLYNGKDTPQTGPGKLLDGSSKAINNRLFTSRKGHQLVFTDGDEDCAVLLTTSDEGTSIRLDKSKKKVIVKSAGDLEIAAKGDVKVTATGKLELSGSQVAIKATGSVDVSGQPIKLN